jgi:putative ATP-dependent endonuclease of OLD family
MATKKKVSAAQSPITQTTNSPRPRLHKLTVSNFRCIGPTPVEIELDDIVILVGPNNAGKSSILRAYEVVMEHGSNEGKLAIEDFPNGKIDPNELPTVELETVVFDKTAPGDKWVWTDTTTNEMFVRERWTWAEAGAPKKVGWDVAASNWHTTEGPWGAPNVAQANRPKPHHVAAFQDPFKQAEQVAEILKDELTRRVKEAKKKRADAEEESGPTVYERLLNDIKELQKAIASDASIAVDKMRADLTSIVGEVFPGYTVTLDARPEDDIDKTVSLFKAGPVLRMGPVDGHQATIERQGSGACRTLLWAALRILAEQPDPKTQATIDRPHLLLMDEPEICLHPDAIREACRVLYDLPKTKNWQVMITTHSPVFIDLARDNTSIVRVERGTSGIVRGTTIFRPARAKLDEDDRTELKLLNLCDPYVAEFFFGGKTILVEGDTEYTAFRHVMAQDRGKYKDVHVVRARGKSCLVSLCKILNQFEKGYAILHDADREIITGKKSKTPRANPAWAVNQRILEVTAPGRTAKKVDLLASVPNFEEAFFGDVVGSDKPFSVFARLKADEIAFKTVAGLLDRLLDSSQPVPSGAIQWSALADLKAAVDQFDTQTSLSVLPSSGGQT